MNEIKSFNCTAESFECKNINLENNKNVELYEFSNVSIKNNLEDSTFYIEDEVFIAFLDNKLHHLILDQIVQYEYLKTLYPNLKILFFKNEYYEESQFADFIFEEYSSFDRLYNFHEENINIKKFIVIYQSGHYQSIFSTQYIKEIGIKSKAMAFENHVKDSSIINPFEILNIDIIQMIGMKILANKFKNLIPKTKNKKIYISRSLANLKNKESNRIERNLRVYEDEHIVEKYFVDLGYESVNLETLSPYDQIKLMRDADVVAGLQGTGMLMPVFCDPGTYVFDIAAISDFDVSYFKNNFLSGIKYKYVALHKSKKEDMIVCLNEQIVIDSKSPKLIIFDLDGVLVDSKDIHYQYLNEALLEIDKKYIISKEEHSKIFDGLSTNKKLEILSKTRGLPENFYNKIWALKQEKSIKFFNDLKKDEELVNIMHYIKKNGIKIAVASNSIKKTVEACLKNLGIIDLVDIYFSNESVLNIKPSPDIYIKCMDYFNISPKDTVIIEDSLVGKMAAINSGARLKAVNDRKDVTYSFINNIVCNHKLSINLLIPMAGEGKRMREAGWEMPKPMIPINGKSMIQTVLENINIESIRTFVVKKQHADKYNIDKHIKELGIHNRIILQEDNVNELNSGAAVSTLLAKKYIDNENPLIIVNSDQYVVWDPSIIYDIIDSGIDGCIFSFKDTDPKWSFSKLNSEGFVSAVSEKNPISDNASCGIYFWKKGSDYIKYAEQMIQKNIKTNNEFYVCPVYNEAISDGKLINISMVKKMYGLGTPEDLSAFLGNLEVK